MNNWRSKKVPYMHLTPRHQFWSFRSTVIRFRETRLAKIGNAPENLRLTLNNLTLSSTLHAYPVMDACIVSLGPHGQCLLCAFWLALQSIEATKMAPALRCTWLNVVFLG